MTGFDMKLEDERRQIEDRIAIRAAIHHGKTEYEDTNCVIHPIDDVAWALLIGFDQFEDGERYVAIQDEQWGAWTGDSAEGKGECVPT